MTLRNTTATKNPYVSEIADGIFLCHEVLITISALK